MLLGSVMGSGRSPVSAEARSTSPAARSCSNGVPSGRGVSLATGRPRSVISTVSPFSTSLSSSLARCRSSRTPNRSHV